MNKDKAIQLLERLQDPEPYEPMLTKDVYDAIQMAIDALSADGDTISREAAIGVIDSFNVFEPRSDQIKLEQMIGELPPAEPMADIRDTQYNLPIGTDTISRANAIEALKNDMASLDHIIKGMSANDVRLDAYVSQRNQVNYDIYTINNLPPVQPEQLDTNLAEVGTDCISRQAAIDAVNCVMIIKGIRSGKSIVAEAVESAKRIMTDNIRDLPPAQLAPDNNGDLWVTVPDIDEVTCIYVQESKSKFCRIFYEEQGQPAQPERIIRCKDCKHWIPYDWMFSEVWRSKNIADYPEDEIGCNYCDMTMKANDFCSRGERREVTT